MLQKQVGPLHGHGSYRVLHGRRSGMRAAQASQHERHRRRASNLMRDVASGEGWDLMWYPSSKCEERHDFTVVCESKDRSGFSSGVRQIVPVHASKMATEVQELLRDWGRALGMSCMSLTKRSSLRHTNMVSHGSRISTAFSDRKTRLETITCNTTSH